MQDMTSEACASQSTPAASVTNVPTKTLTDSRDGNTYTIAKLKDGKCWMTQNLRLSTSMTLTSNDSDVMEDYYLPPSATIDSTNDNPKQFSTSDQYQSKLYYASNTNYGAYYNWYTATAGTGNVDITVDGANAPSSICPKGWRLPTGGNNTGEFYQLLNGVSAANIIKAPYNFVYGGRVSNSTLNDAGSHGYYWSATAYNAPLAYRLAFTSSTVNPSNLDSRCYGHSVRCVAR